MIFIKRFILMLQFLTAIPLPFNLNVKNKDFGKGLVFAPIVGLVLGAILACTYYFLEFVFPTPIISVIIVVFYIVLTGGLHLDGLGDTFDGLFSNRPKKRILEIMRDSRVGTNAVLAVISVILINIVSLSQINSLYFFKAIILFPAAGRIGSIVGAGTSIYARSGEGLGKSFVDYCGIKELIIGLVLVFSAFYLVLGNMGIIAAVICTLSAFIFTRIFSRKIDGVTGDILGAVCELNQTVFLLSFYILQSSGVF